MSGCPAAVATVTLWSGIRVTNVSGISVPDDAVCTTTVMVHTPAIETWLPFAIQWSP